MPAPGYSGDRVMIGPGLLQDGRRFVHRHSPSFSFFCINGPRGDKGRDSKRVQRDAEHSCVFLRDARFDAKSTAGDVGCPDRRDRPVLSGARSCTRNRAPRAVPKWQVLLCFLLIAGGLVPLFVSTWRFIAEELWYRPYRRSTWWIAGCTLMCATRCTWEF